MMIRLYYSISKMWGEYNIQSYPILNDLLVNIFQKYAIQSCNEVFDFERPQKIEVSYLLEGDAINEFFIKLEECLEIQINYFITNSPEVSEAELGLDGVYRKLEYFKGHKVLLDRHTAEGGNYYFLKKLSDNTKREIDSNGSIGVLYLKE